MPPRLRRSRATLLAACLALGTGASSTAAQYPPLAPTPVLPLESFSQEPALTGYLSVRQTVRDDTATFTVNRARITLQILPLRFAALRLQVDLSAVGRTRGDTVPATLLTDAYVQLVPPDTTSPAMRFLRPALVVGQFRTPFSLEYLTPFSVLATASRSRAVDRLSSRRDLGVLAQVRFARFATLTGAVVNGEGPNQTANPDGKQMAVGRLSLFPMRSLALSGKWLGQGGDHRWGYDGRWLVRNLVIEGEALVRTGPPGAAGAASDASGGYLLAAYRIRPWLQPVVKWERLRETTVTPAGEAELRLRSITYGINLLAPHDRLRLQVDWLAHSARPTRASDELVAQLQAIF